MKELYYVISGKYRNYLIEAINWNELMSKKYKKVLNYKRVLNYIEHSLIAVSTIIGCVSISGFAS